MMNTKYFNVGPNISDYAAGAAELILEGAVICFPTETVYGIGCNFYNTQAVSRIFELKNRPREKPLTAHIASINNIDALVSEIPKELKPLAEKFLPGPLTVILKKSEKVPLIVSGGTETIGIRIPANEFFQEMAKFASVPIAATSANYSGAPSSVDVEMLLDYFYGKVNAIFDMGETRLGMDSTVVSLVNEVKVLREGAIKEEAVYTAIRKYFQ